MKARIGFVSNSSSSSFMISLSKITDEQKEAIVNHIDTARKMAFDTFFDSWDIKIESDTLHGCTAMDNFDMETFLSLLGVRNSDITWGDGWSCRCWDD